MDYYFTKSIEHLPFDPEANILQLFESILIFQSWYPIFEKLTFPTVFLPLSSAEARAIVRSYDTRYNARQLLTTSGPHN